MNYDRVHGYVVISFQVLLTVFIKCDVFFEKRGKVVAVLPHVCCHVPAENPMVRVSISELVSKGTEQAVAVRMCAHVTDGCDTCAGY